MLFYNVLSVSEFDVQNYIYTLMFKENCHPTSIFLCNLLNIIMLYEVREGGKAGRIRAANRSLSQKQSKTGFLF